MYARGELNRLGAARSILQHRIRLRRTVSTVQTGRVLKPLRWVDHAYGRWRRTDPLLRIAAVPAGWWLLGRVVRRRRAGHALLRWAPTLWGVLRSLNRGKVGRAGA